MAAYRNWLADGYVVFANFLIGLREGLEASLVVVILIAHLVKMGRRDLLWRIWVGVAFAVLVSIGFGALLTFGPSSLTFQAQEAIGGFLSIIAVGLVTWMIFWMARASRHLAADLGGRLDRATALGSGISLSIIAALAVGREGLETALILWAATSAATSTLVPLWGAALGIGAAIVLAYLIHRGAIRLRLATFFTWTGAFLIVVAAGILAYGIHDLQEAGILPGLNTVAFDVSAAIPPASWYATVLKGIFNFSPVTTVLEAIVWVAYVAVMLPLFLRRQVGGSRRTAAKSPSAAAPAVSADAS